MPGYELIDDKEFHKEISSKLTNIKDILGEPGASDRAASKILNA